MDESVPDTLGSAELDSLEELAKAYWRAERTLRSELSTTRGNPGAGESCQTAYDAYCSARDAYETRLSELLKRTGIS